ncbi:hypothetical protein RHOSPDRAFT_24829 [Rhodotorula sp. JG-1b]|nr:hypothetical protein RHOSPDRAFT_24829 [Rhodotorula sp. JG-1b]
MVTIPLTSVCLAVQIDPLIPSFARSSSQPVLKKLYRRKKDKIKHQQRYQEQMNLYQQQLDRWKAHLEELYEDLAQATFSVQAAEMRDAYGTDTIEFVLEAERRMNRAAESAELCQQEGLQEHDEVKKRIDASRQRYWELMATSFNKLTQGNDPRDAGHLREVAVGSLPQLPEALTSSSPFFPWSRGPIEHPYPVPLSVETGLGNLHETQEPSSASPTTAGAHYRSRSRLSGLVFLGCSLETGFETTLETVFETRGGGNSWLSMARASARSRLPLGSAKLIIGLPVLLLTLVYVLLSLPMFEGIAC